MADAPTVGWSCPTCGYAPQVRGCEPGNCKSTPEPAAMDPLYRITIVEARGPGVTISYQPNNEPTATREIRITAPPGCDGLEALGQLVDHDRKLRRDAFAAARREEALAEAFGRPDPAAPDASAPVVLSRPTLGGPISVDEVERVMGPATLTFKQMPGAQHVDQNPAPWRWHRNSFGDEVNLYDADDVIVACPATSAAGPVMLVASKRVAELLRAAPEMEALLRDVLRMPTMFRESQPAMIAAIERLLARIDERSRG